MWATRSGKSKICTYSFSFPVSRKRSIIACWNSAVARMSSRKCSSSVSPEGSDHVSMGHPRVLKRPKSRRRSRANERGPVNGIGWHSGWKFRGDM